MSNSHPPPFLSPARLLAVGALTAQYQSTLHDKHLRHIRDDWKKCLETTNSGRAAGALRIPRGNFFGAARLVPVDRRSRPLSPWISRKGHVAAVKSHLGFRKLANFHDMRVWRAVEYLGCRTGRLGR